MGAGMIILLVLLYLLLLFLVAFYIEKRAAKGKSLLRSPYIYALSLAVYCTAWTYYGSVGKAATDGLSFLTIYLGPVIVMPLWWVIVRKLIRICNFERISTLADFISSRYDKSVFLSVIVSVLAAVGVIPYISIQLKSISASFDILAYSSVDSPVRTVFADSAFYLTIILAVFVILFAFRNSDTTEKHDGMVGAIAFESIVKLFAFLAVGVYVTYGLFNGFADVFDSATSVQIQKFSGFSSQSGFEWLMLMLLSMSAIILLPRQFQVGIAENTNEKHLKTASWLFPLYLLIINIFVIPIAISGQLLLPDSIDPDSYVLALPLAQNQAGLATFTFIGGFSAATSMIIVSTIALSIMVSNNIVVPLTLKNAEGTRKLKIFPLQTQRLAVFVILLLAYFYFKFISDRFSIVSIGLISFAAILQFMPAVLGGLFWKDANKSGAIAGIIVGFAIWFYTLVVPTTVEIGFLPVSIMQNGLFDLSLLRPHQFLGLNISPVAGGAFWSILFNTIFFAGFSLAGKQSARERNIAEYYVDIFNYSKPGDDRILWKGRLIYEDLIDISEKLVGKKKTRNSVDYFTEQFGKPFDENNNVSSSFVNHMERMISGTVGAASARLIISSASKEEEIELSDVVKILKESTEITRLNKELQIRSYELKARSQALEKANERLKNMDHEKDDFISTVTHELRTPLTSIKAFMEILMDHKDIEEEEKDRFLDTVIKETDRMTRLINQTLDLEKLESGRIEVNMQDLTVQDVLEDSIRSLQHLIQSKKIELNSSIDKADLMIRGDEDRMKQVFINLLSNAIKFVPEEKGEIAFTITKDAGLVIITCSDNGKGIEPDDMERIFDKFYQVRDQTRKKPKGTGLGLSITKRIVELHQGTIELDSQPGEGATFKITLPLLITNETSVYVE